MKAFPQKLLEGFHEAVEVIHRNHVAGVCATFARCLCKIGLA
jgi:hypothetical protein